MTAVPTMLLRHMIFGVIWFLVRFGPTSSLAGRRLSRPLVSSGPRNHVFGLKTPLQQASSFSDTSIVILDEDQSLRFSGVGRLYVDESNTESIGNKSETSDEQISPHLVIVNRLASATVAVFGLGGVGSWAAEALCRSGVGHLVLIDLDDICISNTNRQLHALSSTVGRSKIEEVKGRLLDINPQCNITTVHDFVTVQNANSILENLLPQLTVCLDAIDGKNEKTALIAACAQKGVPVVTCGGAAGRKDPTQIVCADLTKAKEDRLLFWCRKTLRQKYGFKKGPGQGTKNKHSPKKWNIQAVFSNELQKSVPQVWTSSFRRCDGALGTACFVTGTYGFVAASCVVDMIANDRLVVPSAVITQQLEACARPEASP